MCWSVLTTLLQKKFQRKHLDTHSSRHMPLPTIIGIAYHTCRLKRQQIHECHGTVPISGASLDTHPTSKVPKNGTLVGSPHCQLVQQPHLHPKRR